MINILPESSRRMAIWEYRRRVAAGTGFFAAAVCAAGMLALVPSYVQSREAQSSAAQEASLAAESIADSSLTAAATAEESSYQLFNTVLKSSQPRPSAILDLFTAARPSGVRLVSFVYTTAGDRVSATLGGVADTRAELLGFRTALNGIAGVAGADFPAADLAASSTITFSIKLKYTPPAQ